MASSCPQTLRPPCNQTAAFNRRMRKTARTVVWEGAEAQSSAPDPIDQAANNRLLFSHILRDDEWGAILAGQELIGFLASDEALGLGVHVQNCAEGGGRFV